MVEQFRNFVNKNHLFDRQQKVLLAVSGGIDSVVMAHLFARLELQFAIAHCNFQLRGDASDGDERFVEALAGELRCPFFSTRFDTRAYATRQGIPTFITFAPSRHLPVSYDRLRPLLCLP